MRKLIKNFISIVLTLSIIFGILPITELQALAASDGTVSISNEYISVTVSEKNGGFFIKTREGDKLTKSDDNKGLLYHRDEYDTSFTSFEVTYADGSTKEYLFGGSYGFLGMSSSDVRVTKINEDEIYAIWELDDLVFLQKISLVSSGANEHGMVSISYDVENKGSSVVDVKARILLDTAFDNQDFARYQVIDEFNKYQSIWKETVLTASDSIPQNFFACDDPYSPAVTAYTVSRQGQLPYQVAFGHWNNLAASLFSFAPDPEMDFTSPSNEFKTADSAYALYYDLGSIPESGGQSSLITYYGVYSHHDVVSESTMTLDITAPTALTLDSEKKNFVPLVDHGIADFSVQMVLKNLLSDDSSKNKNYSTLTLAIYTSAGLMPLNAQGTAIENIDYDSYEPYIKAYADVKTGDTISDTLYFSAKPTVSAEYRKVKLQVFDAVGNEPLTQDKLLAEKEFYILCPGTDGQLPKFTFTSLTPDIIYYSGTRHLFVTGTNIEILHTSIKSGKCTLKAYGNGAEITIPKENVLQPAPDKLDIILSEDMATGSWYLQLEWSDDAVGDIVEAENQKQTAPALKFVVSDDKQYKNDTYGVVAIVQLKADEPTYIIMSFRNEDEFKAYKEGTNGTKDYEEILLEMRGEFEIVESIFNAAYNSYMPLKIKATSLKTSVDSKATNCININNCIDFEGGTMNIFYVPRSTPTLSYGDIEVLFDGSLYTTGARTSIWKGEAGFTKIEQGKEFSLIPYDTDGEREEKFNDETIALVWPSIFGTAQSIMGMAFKLAYGRLGVMKDDDGNETGRLISFGAKLDLGFLMPKGKDDEDEKEDTYWTRMQQFWKYYKEGERGEYADWLYCNYDKFPIPFGVEKKGDDPYKDDDDKEKAASVMVEDILYGCGKGFIGVHFKAEIAVPNYISGMPKLKGELEVNTIGNWMVDFEGEMELASMTMEVALRLKSYKNIPIPDKIYFAITDFEPGFNVDGHAVLWITGAGGGIDNLYDTIFLTDAVPPLKLMLTVSFDLLKVLSARCDLSIGPRGFSLAAKDIKIKKTSIIALKKAAVELNWYPDLYIMGSLSMDLIGIIKGGGYIVLEGKGYTDWFFEAFVRAAVKVPDSIPIIGGVTVTQVDLGLNALKIWGQLKALGINVGISYFWDDGLRIGTGELFKPTYPELLGFNNVPVYYDEETGATLYIRAGTNLSVAAVAEITDDFDNSFILMGSPYVKSSGDKRNHRVNLGGRTETDAVIVISFLADSMEDARNIANEIVIKDSSNNEYALKLYEEGMDPNEANANVSFDGTKGMLSITMTDGDCYNKDWNIETPNVSDVILYNVEVVPEITRVWGSSSDTAIDISWEGTDLTELDNVKFYLVSDKENAEDSGYPIDVLDTGADIVKGSVSFPIPADIPEGDYYIRAVYAKDDVVNSTVNSDDTVFIRNDNMPVPVSGIQVREAGDLKLDITIDNPTADAYAVNVYQYDDESNSWVPSDVSGYIVERFSLVNNTFTVGGSYDYTEYSQNASAFNVQSTPVKKGLVAGTEYRIGITAINYVDSDDDGEIYTSVSSQERYYAGNGAVADIRSATPVILSEPNPPVVTVTANKSTVKVPKTVGGETDSIDTFASSEITFTVTADKDMTGTWTLDGDGASGSVTGTLVSLPFTNLDEGDHTLTIKGVGPNGDGFRYDYAFTVDTLAPTLILSSPTNGSFFEENGDLTVTGITDADARFTVLCDGVTVCANKTVRELGGSIGSDGIFSFKVTLPNAHYASNHEIIITVSDAVGNTTQTPAEVVHGGLSNIQSLDIYADGVKWSNKNIVTNAIATRNYQLSLAATTKSGVSFILTNDALVSWTCNTVEGTAMIDDDGTLTVGPDSIGFVTGALRVADTGSVTTSITFGAERYSPNYSVVTSATIGGTVTGGGTYDPGDTVTLTAIPNSGYYFAGWTFEGVSVNNTSASTVTFTMPENNVVATATFAPIPTSTSSGSSGSGAYNSVFANAGSRMSMKTPAKSGTSYFVPYYLVDGKKVYVPMSMSEDGVLKFIAPVSGQYFMEERNISFKDTEGHWAEDYIKAATARGLFYGVGNDEFNPYGSMTRSMFVTVLWRLAGCPSGGVSEFTDAVPNAYYNEALAWAANNGIVAGYGNGQFGVEDNVTREQMCVFLVRFLRYLGLDLSGIAGEQNFADSKSISSWAKEAVNICSSLGIIVGRNGNLFAPAANSTRAECCIVFIKAIDKILDNFK